MTKKREPIPKNDIADQIAETKRVLEAAQKSLAEKNAEVSNLRAKLKQLEKSAIPPEDTRIFEGRWFKTEDGTSVDENNKQYYYVIKDHGYKTFTDGSTYRKMTLFDLNMALWDSDGLSDDITIYRKTDQLFTSEELNNLIPVDQNEIRQETLKKLIGIFKILNERDILPNAFKPFITKTKKKKILTPDMGVDKALIDFGKKVLAKAIAKKAK